MKVKVKKISSMLFITAIITGVLAGTDGTMRAADAEDIVVVRITGLTFRPAEITVEPGTTVRWVNEDPFTHDVTSGRVVEGRKARQVRESRLPDGKFHSGAYGKGHGFEFTFKKAGIYPYFCTVHPVMTGSVSVVK
ncbi:MAG: plastocyanin/azurin family copper-binding protein [Thermodesulfobacteriota bacterium]